MEISEEELQVIERRCAEATPGPWISYIEGRDHLSGDSFIMAGEKDIYLTGATSADQDFIAHTKQDIPKLIEEIRRLKTLLKNTTASDSK
jgi:hypothetical protein